MEFINQYKMMFKIIVILIILHKMMNITIKIKKLIISNKMMNVFNKIIIKKVKKFILIAFIF